MAHDCPGIAGSRRYLQPEEEEGQEGQEGVKGGRADLLSQDRVR